MGVAPPGHRAQRSRSPSVCVIFTRRWKYAAPRGGPANEAAGPRPLTKGASAAASMKTSGMTAAIFICRPHRMHRSGLLPVNRREATQRAPASLEMRNEYCVPVKNGDRASSAAAPTEALGLARGVGRQHLQALGEPHGHDLPSDIGTSDASRGAVPYCLAEAPPDNGPTRGGRRRSSNARPIEVVSEMESRGQHRAAHPHVLHTPAPVCLEVEITVAERIVAP